MTMPGWLTEILAEHLHQRGLTAADGDAWVFAWPSGSHLSYSAWRKHWLRATSEAGLPQGFGFHDLRRANATGPGEQRRRHPHRPDAASATPTCA